MANIPFDDRDGFIWVDGEMQPWRDAKIHVLTHGLHYGTSIFEGERAYDGKIFECRAHSERFLRSAEIVYMPMSYSAEQLDDIKYQVLKANDLQDAYIRAFAWRGTQMGLDTDGIETHVGVAAWAWGNYFGNNGEDWGITLKTSQYCKPTAQSAPIHSKCGALYVLSTMAKKEAKQAGYTDALMLDYEGLVAESSAANIFFVKDGELHTPIADRFLNGITRQSVIKLAKENGIEVQERRISPEEIVNMDEIFVTGTAVEVVPVSKIDDQDFQVGPTTKKLRDLYQAHVRTHKPANP